MLKIAGFNPNSYVDYPTNISAVVFIGGCNFDCWFCHNRFLLDAKEFYTKESIIAKIEERKSFLDAVVISGGEPTLEESDELLQFIKEIRALGLLVKLDTNGTNPATLELLLPYVNYVAMDIKAPLSKYCEVTCITDTELLAIKKSIKLIKGIPNHEFRTTFIPTLGIEDIMEIAHTLVGARAYYLQQFVPVEGKNHPNAHSPKTILSAQEQAKAILPTFTRGI